jgi:hypothetical protein
MRVSLEFPLFFAKRYTNAGHNVEGSVALASGRADTPRSGASESKARRL